MKLFSCDYKCYGCEHPQKISFQKPELLGDRTVFQTCTGCGSKLVLKVRRKKGGGLRDLEIRIVSLEVSEKLSKLPNFIKKFSKNAKKVDNAEPVSQ